VVQNFVQTWEYFKPLRDQTFVSQEQRYVDLHRPDGTPDILQFIEHGTLNLVAQAEIIGHMAQTLSNSVLYNYHHLGDAASLTDGLPYNPELGPYEVAPDGLSSGVKDDMWAFTSRNPGLDLRAATMFAATSRALKGYNDDLSERALYQSKRLLERGNGNPGQSAAGSSCQGWRSRRYCHQSSVVHLNRGTTICRQIPGTFMACT
jgi:endoglucanase